METQKEKSIGELLNMTRELKMKILKREPSELEILGMDMAVHFEKRFTGQIWKLIRNPIYKEGVIRDSWYIYLKSNKKSFPYFLGILRNKTKL